MFPDFQITIFLEGCLHNIKRTLIVHMEVGERFMLGRLFLKFRRLVDHSKTSLAVRAF